MIIENKLRPAVKFIDGYFGTKENPLTSRYGIGVEVGVHIGQHAKEILEALPWCSLYLVEIDKKKEQVIKDTLDDWLYRWKLFINSSTEAAKLMDNDLFFVYINADHSYESVKADIEAWWPKVKEKGVLCGHDYGNGETPGVKQAVDEFASKFGLKVNTEEIDWWIIKK